MRFITIRHITYAMAAIAAAAWIVVLARLALGYEAATVVALLIPASFVFVALKLADRRS